MKTLLTSFAAAVSFSVAIFVSLVHPVHAITADLVSISPEPQTDISNMITDAPENVALKGWLAEEGVEYTVVLAVDVEPAVVITPGADIAVDQPWTYDAGTLTVTMEATGLKQTSDGPENAMILAIVAPVALGEDGPPAEMTGSWLSTNVQDWELIPPSEETPAFGFQLTGPAGETGFFHMFMPSAMIDLLGQFVGRTLAPSELAVFNGDSQSSIDIQEVSGGIYININVAFEDTSSSVSATKSSSVTKRITVQEREAVSIAAAKTSLSKGKSTKLYGWLKNGKRNQTVTVWAKAKGEKKFVKENAAKTAKDGYYTTNVTPDVTTTYKIKYRAKKLQTSAIVTITVR